MHRRPARITVVLALVLPAVLLLPSLPAGGSLTCCGRPVTIPGTTGPDTLAGTAGPDVIFGGGGDDIISGLGGNDRLCGGSGNDVIKGGPDRDRLEGGGGDDTLIGGRDGDRILGGIGDDLIDPGPGDNQVLRGQAGRDLIRVYSGTGHLLADGRGFDTLDFRKVAAPTAPGNWAIFTDYEYGQPGEFFLDLVPAQGDGPGPNGTYEGFERTLGSKYDDGLDGTERADRIRGQSGDDRIFAFAGNDRLYGGSGDDEIYASDGDDYLDGGPGYDSYSAGNGWDRCWSMEQPWSQDEKCEVEIVVMP